MAGSRDTRSTEFIERIHIDLAGPMEAASISVLVYYHLRRHMFLSRISDCSCNPLEVHLGIGTWISYQPPFPGPGGA